MKLLPTREFVTCEFPTPPYLVEPMMPQGGIVILHGKPNVGKTNLIATLARSINTGQPLFGRWPVRQGPVVVIQVDMTAQMQQERVIRIGQGLDDTYWLMEEDGSTPLINIQTMSLLKRDIVEAIRAVNPVLIVWDTLRKIHTLSENASETPILVYEAARKVCPLATHLFVHHDRKVSRDPMAVATADEDFMGNQQWKGAADTTMALEELGSSPKRLVLTFHKARTAPDVEKRPFALEQDTDSLLLLPLRAFAKPQPDMQAHGYACHGEAMRLLPRKPQPTRLQPTGVPNVTTR